MATQELTAQQQAAQELLRRQEALDDMRGFRAYMKDATLDFAHAPAHHHDLIIDALHRLANGDTRRLLIMAPPGSAKSTYCSVIFPAWYLAANPTHTVLATSNTTDLAITFNRRRRAAISYDNWSRLSAATLDEQMKGSERWGLTMDSTPAGQCIAAGVGSAIVGLRSHLNILDDPVMSFEQAMSSTQLDKIWAWYESDFRSRLLPTGKELVVTTRWAKNDPAGRILDLVEQGVEEWEVLRLPMLADSDDDPMGREQGQPLWPEWFGQHQIEENKRDPLRWASMYQQVPLDETGSWVAQAHLEIVPIAPKPLRYIVAVDLALSVGKGDWTVILVAGLSPDRDLYICDVHRFREGPNVTVSRLNAVCEQYAPKAVLMDDDPATKVFLRLLVENSRREGRSPLPLRALPLRSQDKETRAAAIRGWFLQDRVKLVDGPWTSDLVSELLRFPNSPNDDQVDCLSLIGRELASTSTPLEITYGRSGNKVVPLLTQRDNRTYLTPSLDDLFRDQDEAKRRNWNRKRI